MLTVLLYLNDVAHGGNTTFLRAHAQCADADGYFGVRPTKRSAVFFYDLREDGNVDERTEHRGEPPSNGSEKWMTNLWIWDPHFQPQFGGYDVDEDID